MKKIVNKKKIVIIGAGRCAKVVVDILLQRNKMEEDFEIVDILDVRPIKFNVEKKN